MAKKTKTTPKKLAMPEAAKTKKKRTPAALPIAHAQSPSKPKSKAQAPAAPLLAASAKKVGSPKPLRDPAPTAKPARSADDQPKTDAPKVSSPVAVPARAVPAVPPIDPLALISPWMNLGLHATAAGLTMQARLVRLALAMPPATIALRQSTQALNSWLALTRTVRPRQPKD